MRVLIRGAGVAGLTLAYELTRRGAEVIVVERSDRIGGGASWCAGGMLAPWCESEDAGQQIIGPGRRAAAWWEAALPGVVRSNGTLVVAPPRDAGELDRFARRTGGHAWLDGADIADLEPVLAGRFSAGLLFREEAHLDPRAALERLHTLLVGNGARFYFDATGPALDELVDVHVDCTGMTRAAADPELRGVRGEMLYLHAPDMALSRPVRLLHPRFPVYVVPRGDGRFMVGATMIESASAAPITARSMMELLNAAYAVHPAFGEAEIIETAVGIRPAYPDNVPRVKRGGAGAEIAINGLYRHGFLMAPALAAEACRLLSDPPETMEFANETDRQRADA